MNTNVITICIAGSWTMCFPIANKDTATYLKTLAGIFKTQDELSTFTVLEAVAKLWVTKSCCITALHSREQFRFWIVYVGKWKLCRHWLFFPLDLITVCLWQYLICYVFTKNCLGNTMRLFFSFISNHSYIRNRRQWSNMLVLCTTPVVWFIVKVDMNSVGLWICIAIEGDQI